MKKSLILVGMLSIGYAKAQTTDYEERVGINTETPSATLNVKTPNNTKSSKNLELEDQEGTKLVTVLNNGNIGLRNDKPTSGFVISPANNTYAGNSVNHMLFRDSGSVGEYGFYRGRGTEETPLSVAKGDEQGTLVWKAYNGTEFKNTVIINPTVSGDVVEGKILSSLDFAVQRDTGDMRRTMRLSHNGNIAIGPQLVHPLAPIHIQMENFDITDREKEKGQKDMILMDMTSGGQNADTKERVKSIAAINWASVLKPATYRSHSIDFGLLNPSSKQDPFMAFRVAKLGYPATDTETAVEHMRITSAGNIGIGTNAPSHKLHIKAGENPLKLEGLQSGTGETLVVDADGVVKKGTVMASNVNGTQNEISMQCNDANRGKTNFVKDVTLSGGGSADAFAVCLKGSDGNHYWRYLYGAGGETTGSGAFGTGLN